MQPLSIVLLLLLVRCSLSAQTLNLNEILQIREMDSVQLVNFVAKKGFQIKEIQETKRFYAYNYYAPAGNGISFIRTFAKDSTDNRYVYYYFTDSLTQHAFEKEVQDQGFTFNRKIDKENGGYKLTHNFYLNENKEIDLGSEKLTGQNKRYFLLYYRRIH